MSSNVTVIAGKLKFKGSNNNSKKRKISSIETNEIKSTAITSSEIKEDNTPLVYIENDIVGLTETEKRHRRKKQESIKRNLSSATYRDRMDLFNDKLSRMTEHNDIPRVSAAGNG